ncbi:MAG: phosphoheptose isomerase [Rhodospirillales bacterium RIFCSPLOWO2_12_FULL_58_28]|nr:MAG: phosphoheptose isomerase [Rhodospirillales bacterium RIFCSPLOWO2_02_FULL_58_16]OHC79356.1 MAG: phosphoheptose isomerase [Rhodospirillales bacterium RIFCSPLOWO2_12_FULL_58_28]
MTFPDEKYKDIAAYGDAYFERLGKAAASVDRGKLGEAARILTDVYRRRATLYVCGNGGSAVISATFVCDHVKLIQTDTDLVPRVVSLNDNISMITAISNDISYDDIFVYQLKSSADPGDALLTISSSGDSENVVRAAQWARNNKLEVISFTGFSGGRTAKTATVNLHVEADNYGIIEDTHQSLMHILAQYIRLSIMPPDLIAKRKF